SRSRRRRRSRLARARRRRRRAGGSARAARRRCRVARTPRPCRPCGRAGPLLGRTAGGSARGALRPPRGVKVSVLAFDLSDNATGRADLLARLLAPRYDVEVVGPRFGTDVWRPARDGAVRYRSEPGASWPRLAPKLPALARIAAGDV